MTLSIKSSACVLALSTILVACSDEDAPIITGENTVIAGTSAAVFDTNGNDLTAINQTNFPLPIPGVFGAALPESTVTPAPGEEEETIPQGQVTTSTGIYFPDVSPEAQVDPLGALMSLLVDAIGSGVATEFEAVTGVSAYSASTEAISNRLRLSTTCTDGGLSSTLQANGASVTGGIVTFTACESEVGAILDGTVDIEPMAATVGEGLWVVISMNVEVLEDNVVQLDAEDVVLTGALGLVSLGDEFRVTSEQITIAGYGVNRQFGGTDVTGRVGTYGSRTLNGVTNMQNLTDGYSIGITFEDVGASSGLTFPVSGNIDMVHSGGDNLFIGFSSVESITQLTREDGTFLQGFLIPASESQTYVPFE